MPGRPTFWVQVFEWRPAGYVPGARVSAASAAEAVATARAMIPVVPGAAALCITADPDTGELQAATILETIGEVPESFAEGLLDG